MKAHQCELEARVTVDVLPGRFQGPVQTDCQSIRLRNVGSGKLKISIGQQAFIVKAGDSWGFDTGRDTIVIRQTLQVSVENVVGAEVLVERIYLTPLLP